MRKYRLLSLLILALFAYSCNSWLDVKPEDELDESDMFATGDGYRHDEWYLLWYGWSDPIW